MLKKYLKAHNLTIPKLAELIGISRQALTAIIANRPAEIKFSTAIKIKNITGLYPWDYVNGLENIKRLYQANYEVPKFTKKSIIK